MKIFSVECKVGLFVLLAIAVLSLIVFQIGGINLFKTNMYSLNVTFDFVSGIEINSPVHFAGVHVGEVKDVEIFYNKQQKKSQVKLNLNVKNKVRIPKDSAAYINTLGILGEKYVEIVPGNNRDEFLADNDTIVGNNPVQLEKLTESLVDIVGDQSVRDSLRQSFYNVRQATDNLVATSKTFDELIYKIKNGEGTIGKFINDDSLYVKTEQMVDNLSTKLDKTVTDLNNQLNDLMNDLKKHPWKLLQRPSRRAKQKADKENGEGNLGYIYKKE